MTSLSKEVNVLSGYKTYGVAVITAIVGVVNIIHHSNLNFENVTALLGAGGLSALRAAIAKVELALKTKPSA